jgi:gamma-F420-2:alpha-L-glutamate ligase
MKVWLLQNDGPETYEVNSILSNLHMRGIDAKSYMLDETFLEKPDIAFVRNTRWSNYEKLKRMEADGVRFINKIDPHYLVCDKWRKYDALMKAGLRVPKTLLLPLPFEHTMCEKIGDEIGFPCIIKRRYGAYGIGVELCQDENDLYRLAKKFIKEFGDKTVIAQRYVSYSPDYMALFWVGGNMRAHIAKAPEGDRSFLSYQKPEHTSSRTPYPINDNLRLMVEPAMRFLDIDVARLDILFDSDGYIICEVNSPGGFRGFEMVHKIDMGKIITDYIIEVGTNG